MLQHIKQGQIVTIEGLPTQLTGMALHLTVVLLCLSGGVGAEELSTRRALRQANVAQALAKQERWLGTDRNGAQWHEWLRTSTLREALAADGDPKVLELGAVLERYEADFPGLEREPIAGVRRALAGWIEVLPPPSGRELASKLREGMTPAVRSLATQKSQLLRSLTEIERSLAQRKQTGAEWRAHLRMDELGALLGQEEGPALEPLVSILDRFETGHATLERPEFRAAREALGGYCREVRWSSLDGSEAELTKCLDRLALALEKSDEKRSTRALQEVGECLAWCDAHGVKLPLVQTVRRIYVQPNLIARVNGQLVFGQFEQQIDEQIPIRDSMNGATVRGSGHLKGKVRFELAPDDRRAAILMRFQGTMSSQITGQAGPVGFAGGGNTRIAGEKWMYADEHEVRSLSAEADADTSMRMHSVWSNFRRPLFDRIARRIGWRQVQANRPSSEQHVSRKAERDFSQRFDQQAREIVAAMNDSYVNMVRVPLRQQGVFPTQLRLSTTRKQLAITATLAEGAQLAAATAAPEADEQAGASMVMHESLLNNAANQTLAGKTLESSELAASLEPILGRIPTGFDSVDGVPWALTLMEKDPLEVRFSPEGMRLTIRSRRITSGAEQIDIPFTVSADYRGEIDGKSMVFTRQGGLELLSPTQSGDWSKLNDGVTDSRAEIQQRFEMLLQERIVYTMDQFPLQLPGHELVPTRFETSEGWLLMTLDAVQAPSEG
jgi:hypothetical protein